MKLCSILHENQRICPTCGNVLQPGQSIGPLIFPDQQGHYNIQGLKYEPEEVEHLKTYDSPPEIDFSQHVVDPKSTTGLAPYNPGSEDPTQKLRTPTKKLEPIKHPQAQPKMVKGKKKKNFLQNLLRRRKS